MHACKYIALISFVDDSARLANLSLFPGEHLDGAHPHHGAAEQSREARAGGQRLDGGVGQLIRRDVLVHLEDASPRQDLLVVAVVHRQWRCLIEEDQVFCSRS